MLIETVFSGGRDLPKPDFRPLVIFQLTSAVCGSKLADAAGKSRLRNLGIVKLPAVLRNCYVRSARILKVGLSFYCSFDCIIESSGKRENQQFLRDALTMLLI